LLTYILSTCTRIMSVSEKVKHFMQIYVKIGPVG
jgi:hypothetical protein